MTARIRVATPQDADAVAAIYAPVVRETPISILSNPGIQRGQMKICVPA